MALTETWIKPEDNATPAALSNNFSFSHTPRLTGRGGGTGLLISNNWKFTHLPSLSINSSFESHSVTITRGANLSPFGEIRRFLLEIGCDEWGGAESRGNGARPVELMIMSDTCTTHRSRVPRRSSGRIKGGATTVEDERGPGLDFNLCFVCGSRP